MTDKLKAGLYYVGDLCYVLDGNGFDWHEVLDKTNYFMDNNYFEYGDFRGFCSGTMHGDGSYCDQEGRTYHVDAGIIGCVPREALPEELTNPSHTGGRFIEFPEDFTCAGIDDSDLEGEIQIGHIRIETA